MYLTFRIVKRKQVNLQIQAFLSSQSEHFNSVTDKTFTFHIKENVVSKLTEILYRNGFKKSKY